jgi:hypothetical protein
MAEAVGAYAVWRALPTDTMDSKVGWPSGEGYDIVTTYRGKQCRINTKVAWRYGAPTGKLYCAPITIPKSKDGKPKLDVFALVVLEYNDLWFQYDQLPDETVKLEAEAKSDEIYYLSVAKVITMLANGDLHPHGRSTARWIILESALTGYRTLSFEYENGT